jgi:hypothetical protein
MAGMNPEDLRESVSYLVDPIDKLMGNEERWYELERLVAQVEEQIARKALAGTRWADLKRHLCFREPVDWYDIVRSDWPSVRRLLATDDEPSPGGVEGQSPA